MWEERDLDIVRNEKAVQTDVVIGGNGLTSGENAKQVLEAPPVNGGKFFTIQNDEKGKKMGRKIKFDFNVMASQITWQPKERLQITDTL